MSALAIGPAFSSIQHARCLTQRWRWLLISLPLLMAGCASSADTLPGTVVSMPPTTASGVTAPIWKAGDEWAYHATSPDSDGTFVWTLDRIEILRGEKHYVIKTGTREIYYRVTNYALTQETVDGKVVRQIRPAEWRWLDFPLTVGKSWEMNYTEERPGEGQTEEVQRKCKAEARENITVPAGTFETIRVTCHNRRNEAKVLTIWYSPAVRQMVRGELVLSTGPQVRELITYKLR